MRERVDLFFRDEQSDKTYSIWKQDTPEGVVVQVRFGRRAQTQQQWDSGTLTVEAAEKLYTSKLNEKLRKRYKAAETTQDKVDAIAAHFQAAPAKAGPVDLLDPRQVASVAQRRAREAQETATASPVTSYPPELLTPIEDREAGRYIVDPRYLAQDKRNGHRRLVVKNLAGVYGITRPGRVVDLPDGLASDLRKLPFDVVVMDGELEGDKFIAFDLLNLDDELGGHSYEERFKMLVDLLRYGLPHVKAVETAKSEADKEALCRRLATEKAEGIVFKLRTGTYRAGRNGQHMKWKFWKTATVRISKPRATGKDSAMIQLLDGAKWREVGHVSLIGKPVVEDGTLVEVKYLYATRAKKVVQATILMVRDDVPESSCTLAQLVINRDEEAA